jgi:hypothetical protein
VRTSAATTAQANIAGALKQVDGPLGPTTLQKLEKDWADKPHQASLNEARDAVGEEVPADTPLLQQIYSLLGLARKHLLLLEAVSLSPVLSWALCYVNGVYPLLQMMGSLVAAATIHPEMIEVAGAPSTSALAVRIDDVMSHAFVVLSGLARVAYEIRSSGDYSIDLDDGAFDDVPEHLDRRILGEQVFSPYMASIVCACIKTLASSGLSVPLFVGAAVPLSGWLASAVNMPSPPGDDDWGTRYLAALLDADFTEASVSLLRMSISMAAKAEAKGAKGGAAGSESDAAGARITYDVSATVVANLQHIAVHPSGAMAVTTRGASRQLLRSIPALLAACGASQRHPSYRALVSALSLLNVCVTDEEGGGAAGDEAAAGEAMSVPRLLYKQGLVDAMLSVAFSAVGVGAAESEACQVALSIVSAVSGRRDVTNALLKLETLSERVAEGIASFSAAAALEADGWQGVAALGNAAKTAPTSKHAVLVVEDMEEAADESAGAGEDDDEEGGVNKTSKASPLLGALQIFGLLITTEAGRRAGSDTAAAGIAACASLLRSSSSYLATATRVQDGVLAAAAAITASTDDKAPAALPAPIATAASAALAAPPRNERDLLNSIETACQVIRVTLSVVRERAIADAAEAGVRSSRDALSALALSAPDSLLSKSLAGAVDTSVGALESATQPGLARLSEAAQGKNLLGSAASGGSKAGGRGAGTGAGSASGSAGAALPSQAKIVVESSATLAALCDHSVCAETVPASNRAVGLDTLLATLASARENKLGTAEADAKSLESSGLVTECNIMAVLDGVASSSSKNAAVLSGKKAADAVMASLDAILQASISSTNDSGASTLSKTDAVSGLAHALSTLACLSTSHKEVEQMLGAGLISFLKSAAVLLPDDMGSAGGGGPGAAGAAEGAEGADSGTQIKGVRSEVVALLVRSMALLMSRLATIGYLLNGDESEDEDLSFETQNSGILRELAVRLCAAQIASTAISSSLPSVQACLKLALDFAVASEGVPARSAERTLNALRAGAGKLGLVAKKAMTTGGAGPELMSLGRKVVTLLAPKAPPKPPGAAKGGPAPEVTPLEDTDELRGAVADLQAKVGVLGQASGLLVAAPPPPPGTTVVAPPPGKTYSPSADAVERAERALLDVLDSVRSLSLQVGQRFPMPITDDGAGPVSAAALADAEALRSSLGASAMTEGKVFAALKGTLVNVAALLCNDKARPALSKRGQAAAFDVLSGTTPMVARMAVFAETLRAAQLTKYYEDNSVPWEIEEARDVPLNAALAAVSQSLEAHITSADSVLAAGAAGAEGAASPAALLGSYAVSPAAVDAICRSVRVIVSGCGKEAVTAVSQVGVLASLLKFATTMRRFREDALAGMLEGGRERGRALAAECDKVLTAINGTTRSLLSKSEEEIKIYAHSQSANDPDVRSVETVISVAAMTDLLRAAAALATQAAAESSAEGGDSKRNTAAEDTLDAQAAALVASLGGSAAAWSVLDAVSSSALSSLSGVDASSADGAESRDSRDNLRVFSSVLAALAKAQASGGTSGGLPTDMRVMRTLYATIATCMQTLTGDEYSEAVQAASALSLTRDKAADEFASKDARADDTDVALWTAPAGGFVKLASSKLEDAVVEEL